MQRVLEFKKKVCISSSNFLQSKHQTTIFLNKIIIGYKTGNTVNLPVTLRLLPY